MSTLSSTDLIELIEKSGLIDAEKLRTKLEELGLESSGGEELGNALVEQGLLTPWQNDRLQKGRWKGFRLGKYELLDLIGVGGMGRVYLATHRMLSNRVAIKVLPRDRLARPGAVERFEREARAAANLNHPNITRTFDIDREGRVHYIVMEFIEGRNLHMLVQEEGRLEPGRAARYIRQIADGLDCAHQKGLIHRDIKPANVVVDENDIPRILDFGLARLDDEEDGLTADTGALGTVDYVAPEQAINTRKADHRADLYSLGCTLYYMLTGQPPFPGGTKLERILKHCKERPQSIAELRSDVPEMLLRVWHKMTRKKPQKRYETAGELVRDLDALLADPPQTPPSFLTTIVKAGDSDDSTATAPKPAEGRSGAAAAGQPANESGDVGQTPTGKGDDESEADRRAAERARRAYRPPPGDWGSQSGSLDEYSGSGRLDNLSLRDRDRERDESVPSASGDSTSLWEDALWDELNQLEPVRVPEATTDSVHGAFARTSDGQTPSRPATPKSPPATQKSPPATKKKTSEKTPARSAASRSGSPSSPATERTQQKPRGKKPSGNDAMLRWGVIGGVALAGLVILLLVLRQFLG